MIRFDIEYVRYFPVPTFDVEEFPFEVPMLFPFWSKIDIYDSFCSSEKDCLSGDIDYENRSAVFYQVYTKDNNAMNASYILDKASKDVRENSNDPEFQNFTASWVLVVTWLRLRPEEEAEGDAEEGVVSLSEIQINHKVFFLNGTVLLTILYLQQVVNASTFLPNSYWLRTTHHVVRNGS